MARFDSAIALAQRLIKKNGQAVTLRSFKASAIPDATMPWKPGENLKQDVEVDAVFLDYEQKYVDGTLIQRGDQKILMPATSTSGADILPEVEGLVIRDGTPWKVISIKPLNPNGQAIMFELQVRT